MVFEIFSTKRRQIEAFAIFNGIYSKAHWLSYASNKMHKTPVKYLDKMR